jgi:hypothetical protein
MHVRPRVNCLILIFRFRPKSEYIDTNLLKITNRKFHENTSGGSRSFPWHGQRDGQIYDAANSRSSRSLL